MLSSFLMTCAFCGAELSGKGRSDRVYCDRKCKNRDAYKKQKSLRASATQNKRNAPARSIRHRVLAELQKERTTNGFEPYVVDDLLCSIATMAAYRRMLAQLESQHRKMVPSFSVTTSEFSVPEFRAALGPGFRAFLPMDLADYRPDKYRDKTHLGIGGFRARNQEIVVVVLAALPKSDV